MADESSWQEQRRENARLQQERMLAREEASRRQAAALLKEFAKAAQERLAPEQLEAFNPANGRKARTGISGWYLKKDRSVGVGTNGAFYILTRPITLKERLCGVKLSPSDEPMVLGKGGRDGESMDLPDALEKLLPNWRA